MTDTDSNQAAHALARQRLLIVTAVMFESLYEREAISVLGTLKPADMRPGGARVPGTSYELPPATAARAMRALLALREAKADALLLQLAEADEAARLAVLTGKPPPLLASLYPHMDAVMVPDADSLTDALRRLHQAAGRIFSLTQMRRIDKLCGEWNEQPELLDATPVQQYVARFVRNAPP